MNVLFKQILCVLMLFQNLYADESLYKDYKPPKSKNLAERIGIEFSYDYMQTNGINGEDRASVGTSINSSYLLWRPNDNFDLSANLNSSHQEPIYMSMIYYGVSTKYHINRNHTFRFLYTDIKQGEIRIDNKDINLGKGKLWGVGYEYKLNDAYRFFFDYKKAFLRGSGISYYSGTRNEKYNIAMFSMGLGANFIKKKNTHFFKNDGRIEDMSISIGYSLDFMNLEIRDEKNSLNYATKNTLNTPIIIKSESFFLNKSKTLGYKPFSFGFNLFDYNKKIGDYSISGIPEDVEGYYIYFAPSLFYTDSFTYKNRDLTWKLEANLGASFLTLDAKEIDNLDIENKLGIYGSLGTEIGIKLFDKKDFMLLKYSYIKQRYNNHNTKYDISGNTFGVYINLKFKDIFSKDW